MLHFIVQRNLSFFLTAECENKENTPASHLGGSLQSRETPQEQATSSKLTDLASLQCYVRLVRLHPTSKQCCMGDSGLCAYFL